MLYNIHRISLLFLLLLELKVFREHIHLLLTINKSSNLFLIDSLNRPKKYLITLHLDQWDEGLNDWNVEPILLHSWPQVWDPTSSYTISRASISPQAGTTQSSCPPKSRATTKSSHSSIWLSPNSNKFDMNFSMNQTHSIHSLQGLFKALCWPYELLKKLMWSFS